MCAEGCRPSHDTGRVRLLTQRAALTTAGTATAHRWFLSSPAEGSGPSAPWSCLVPRHAGCRAAPDIANQGGVYERHGLRPAPLCFGTFQIDEVYAMRREASFPSPVLRLEYLGHFQIHCVYALLPATDRAAPDGDASRVRLAAPRSAGGLPHAVDAHDGMASTGDACCDPADGDHGQPDKPHPCKPGQSARAATCISRCSRASRNHSSLPRRSFPQSNPRLLPRPTGVWRPPAPSEFVLRSVVSGRAPAPVARDDALARRDCGGT